jgi:protein subunit release factor A
MENIHYTKKDFTLEWYSGSGAGGQHRNKHQNCCRITHIESGLQENGTESRSRVENQKTAFTRLAKRVVAWAMERQAARREINNEVIRNYNGYRNEVHDKASGLKLPYDKVVVAGDLAEMIEARLESKLIESHQAICVFRFSA